MPDYAWIGLNMPEYAEICVNLPENLPKRLLLYISPLQTLVEKNQGLFSIVAESI